MEYNQTWEQHVHKYTINLPKEVFKELQERSRRAGILRVSIYLRAIIEKEIRSGKIFSVNEILQMQKISKVVASRDHRRARLENNTRYSRFKNKMLDILSNFMYNFRN